MDQDRRKFLKIVLMGSGALLIEGILGPLRSWIFGGSSGKNSTKTNSLKTVSENFRIVRNHDGLSIYDSTGEEIFQVDNNA